jgi:hypothetical protein
MEENIYGLTWGTTLVGNDKNQEENSSHYASVPTEI